MPIYVNNIHMITRDTPITLTPNDNSNIDVIITTKKQSAGYTITKSNRLITSVYFTSEATREQLEGRINRIGQIKDIDIIIYHCGLLSYIYEKYKKVRNMSECLKGFAKEIQLN